MGINKTNGFGYVMSAREGLAAGCIKHRGSLVEVRLHVGVSNGGFALNR